MKTSHPTLPHTPTYTSHTYVEIIFFQAIHKNYNINIRKICTVREYSESELCARACSVHNGDNKILRICYALRFIVED